MLTDPVAVTYNSVSTDLARSTGIYPGGEVKRYGQTCYKSATGELVAFVTHSIVRGGHHKVEILLGKVTVSADYDPFDREAPANYAGFTFITDKFSAEPADVDLLDAALRSWIGDSLRDRFIAGEE